MRRPLLAAALFYAAGVALGDWFEPPLPALFAVSFALGIAALCLRPARWLLVPAFLTATGWTNFQRQAAPLDPQDLRRLLDERPAIVTARGQLTSAPEQRWTERLGERRVRSLATLDLEALCRDHEWQPASGRVLASTPDLPGDAFFPGRRIEITGVLQPPPGPDAPGLFDYRAHLARRGIHYVLRSAGPEEWRIADRPGNHPRPPLATRFCAWAQTTLGRGLPAVDQPLQLQWAMVLGWRTALTDEVAEPFMRSGTMHIFAISGLHVVLLANMLVAVLRVLQLPRGGCGLLVAPALWFYTAATGWQASAIRATLMMTIVIGSWSLRRPADLLNSLCGAAFLILLWEPSQLFQASFQLSFFVVLSLALLQPPLERLRQRWLAPDPLQAEDHQPRWRRLAATRGRWLWNAATTSLASWLGSWPLIASYFHLVTPVSLLANLVIVPISSLALCSGLASLAVGAWWPGLAELFNHAGWFYMWAMIDLSERFAHLPGAWWHIQSPTALVYLAYYGTLGAWLTGAFHRPTLRCWCLLSLGAVVAIAGARHWHHRSDWHIHVLPAHGGDTLWIEGPGRRDDTLLDTGDALSAEFLTAPWLRAQGVNRLPHLVLSHGDARHVSGATNILEQFRPRSVSTGPIRSRSPAYRKIQDGLARNEIPGHPLRRGDRWGPWTVLHPAGEDRFPLADDQALVLRLEVHGLRVLLCSDLGSEGQRVLVERESDLRADIVIAGMPGRNEPLGDALLDAIQPRLILLSASGTPANERVSRTLESRLQRHRIPWFTTGTHGALSLRITPHGPHRAVFQPFHSPSRPWPLP